MPNAVITSNFYFSTNVIRGHKLDSKGAGYGQVVGSYKLINEAPHSTNGEEFLGLVINIHRSFPGLSFGRLVDWSVGWPVGQQFPGPKTRRIYSPAMSLLASEGRFCAKVLRSYTKRISQRQPPYVQYLRKKWDNPYINTIPIPLIYNSWHHAASWILKFSWTVINYTDCGWISIDKPIHPPTQTKHSFNIL